MCEVNNMDNDLLDLLAQELGEIHRWEEECPGVYYLAVIPNAEIAEEYYIVLEDAPISQEARAMGRPLKSSSARAYLLDSEDGAHAAVKYEVLRYLTLQGLPLPEGSSLGEAALFGMERRPDYFGAYPVPFLTPWGLTLRHRPLDNGIYWIETERCVEILAVCHPVCEELSEGLPELGRTLEAEGEMGYLYFQKEAACVAIWELLRVRSELTTSGLIRRTELMNAIWEHQPGYALGYNAQEQAGLHDALGLLLYALGVEDRELEGSPEYMIAVTEGVGTDYIGFWK